MTSLSVPDPPRRDSRPAGSTDTPSSSDVARSEVRSFRTVAGVFALLLVISLAASWGALEVVGATRAYATVESRHSKATKIAVLHLHRYAYSGEPGDYAAFLQAIAIPESDRTARLALEEVPPNLAIARQALLEGENHVDDIASLIFMFRWVRGWQPFAAAIEDWRAGDAWIEELLAQGASLHEAFAARRLDPAARDAMLEAIDRANDRLTELESAFTSHLGEAARGATRLVLVGLGATIVILWAVGMAFAWRLLRRQLTLVHQLGSSEQRFRDYAEVASDWYWETDAAHCITYLSRRFIAAAGPAGHALLNRPASEFIHEHSDGADSQSYLTALDDHRPFRGLRLRYARHDGSIGYWSLAGRPHVDAAGAFLGYRGVGTDISAAVDDQRMLREAKTRAEGANRAKSEFLANMSHELRTPLNAILGFSEVITKLMFGRWMVDRYADYAGDINRSGRHLLSIIDDILDLSKVEAGHSELSEAEITFDDVASGVRTLFGDRFLQAELTLHVGVPAPPVRLRIDERKLTQALVNLLSNALKFTPPGGSVTLAARLETDGSLGISVRDTGIGIAPEQIEVALAPFGQIESTFSRQHHGTGLGLSLAKSLVELHGGALRLESRLGVGTVVTLVLPRARVVGAPAAAAPSSQVGE